MRYYKILIATLLLVLIVAANHGCRQSNIEFGDEIKTDLQTITNSSFAEVNGTYYCILEEGIYMSTEYPFNFRLVIEGKFHSLMCNDKYIFCIMTIPCDDDNDYSKEVLVRYEVASWKCTQIAEYVASYTFVGNKIVYQYEPNWFYTKQHQSLRKNYGALFVANIDGSNCKKIVDSYASEFLVVDGKLWYGEIAGLNHSLFVYDFTDDKSVFIGSTTCGSYTFSFGKYLFRAESYNGKMFIWDTDACVESVVDISVSDDTKSYYAFPVQYEPEFEDDSVVYRCTDYIVIAVNRNNAPSSQPPLVFMLSRPYIAGNKIVWFGW